jgi:hypothetical protein
MPSVIAVGAGALTLGMIAPVTAEAGLDLIIISRLHTSEHHQRLASLARRGIRTLFAMQVPGTSVSLEPGPTIPVEAFLDIESSADRKRAVAAMSRRDCVGVVAAARDSFHRVVPILNECASLRSEVLPVLGADNTKPAGWPSSPTIPSQPGVRYLSTVADRLCLRFPESQPNYDVWVEPYVRWAIPSNRDTDQLPLITAISSSSAVEVGGSFDDLHRQKFYLVNGLHFALAIRGYDEPDPQLNTWIARNFDEALQISRAILAAYNRAFPGDRSGLSDAFTSTIVERFRKFPDLKKRILGLAEKDEIGDPEALRERLDQRLGPLKPHAPDGALADIESAAMALAERWEAHPRS